MRTAEGYYMLVRARSATHWLLSALEARSARSGYRHTRSYDPGNKRDVCVERYIKTSYYYVCLLSVADRSRH